uniref:Uncharacterized protein n=1 Tax=Triticum urartu TaxID=4572 RepID=A0A8R7REQ0_TRIUA
MQEEHDDRHVEALAPDAPGAVLAVHGPELSDVGGGAPPEEEREMVAESRVLVDAHDGEERVEHLVGHLRPPPPARRVWHVGVERPHHEQEHEDHPRSNEGEPHEQRGVHGM